MMATCFYFQFIFVHIGLPNLFSIFIILMEIWATPGHWNVRQIWIEMVALCPTICVTVVRFLKWHISLGLGFLNCRREVIIIVCNSLGYFRGKLDNEFNANRVHKCLINGSSYSGDKRQREGRSDTGGRNWHDSLGRSPILHDHHQQAPLRDLWAVFHTLQIWLPSLTSGIFQKTFNY